MVTVLGHLVAEGVEAARDGRCRLAARRPPDDRGSLPAAPVQTTATAATPPRSPAARATVRYDGPRGGPNITNPSTSRPTTASMAATRPSHGRPPMIPDTRAKNAPPTSPTNTPRPTVTAWIDQPAVAIPTARGCTMGTAASTKGSTSIARTAPPKTTPTTRRTTMPIDLPGRHSHDDPAEQGTVHAACGLGQSLRLVSGSIDRAPTLSAPGRCCGTPSPSPRPGGRSCRRSPRTRCRCSGRGC